MKILFVRIFINALIFISLGQNTSAQNFTIEVDTTRKYRVHLPDDYTPEVDHPLMLALHGGFGFNWQFEIETKLSDVSDTAGVIIVYPQAIGTSRSWNTGKCCGWAFNNDIDDLKFIDHLLDELIVNYSIDTTRIYATGFSSGAMMSYALGCKLSHRFAAIAPVSSSMIIDNCNPDCLPIPIIHIHASEDSSALFYGGYSDNPLLDFYYPPVDSVMTIWSEKNNCNTNIDTTYYPNGSINTQWMNDSDEILMELWLADDGGHKWPGTEGVGILSGDNATQDFYATELVWNFLRQHKNSCNTELGLYNSPSQHVDISISPNPFNDQFQINIPYEYVELNASIFNTNGELLITNNNELRYSIHNLKSGIYILKLEIDGELFVKKIMKL